MEYYVKSVISIIESNYHKLTSAEKTVADFFIHNNQNTDFSSSHIAELLYIFDDPSLTADDLAHIAVGDAHFKHGLAVGLALGHSSR